MTYITGTTGNYSLVIAPGEEELTLSNIRGNRVVIHGTDEITTISGIKDIAMIYGDDLSSHTVDTLVASGGLFVG